MTARAQLVAAVASLFVPATVLANGFVTPTVIEITVTRLSIWSIGEPTTSITLEGSYPVTYTKAGGDLEGIPMTDVAVPAGRYGGGFLQLDRTVYLTIDGETYRGLNENGIDHGDRLWTTGTGLATDLNSITTSEPLGGATRLAHVFGEPGEPGSNFVFSRPVCISEDDSLCQVGDLRINPATEEIDINIMLDLYGMIMIVTGESRVWDVISKLRPFVSFGRPGAAFHLTYEQATQNGADIGNIALLFDASQQLMFALAEPPAWFASTAPPCPAVGGAWVHATAAPAGHWFNSAGDTIVTLTDPSGTGTTQFATQPCLECGEGYGGGVNLITSFIQQQGNAAEVACVPDSQATPPFLGYTYSPEGLGRTGTATYVIQRIVDPANLFGVCDQGTCGTY